MKVDALHILAPGKMEVRSIDLPDPAWDEVQIQVKACGVCAWDSYLYQVISNPKPVPYTFGHEGTGIITKVGAGVKNFKEGDKVFAANSTSDMMMQYTNQSYRSVTKISGTVTDWLPWTAEPVVCVVSLLHLTNVPAGAHVVLVGAGYMGLLTLQGLQAEPWGKLTVFELREDRRVLASKYAPPDSVFDPESPTGKERIEEIIAHGGADVIIEFSAHTTGFEIANRLIKNKNGKLVIGSWHRHGITLDAAPWHLNGLFVLNLAPNANPHFEEMIPATAALINRGIYKPGEYVTHTADYHTADSLFVKSIDKTDGYIKGVVTF
jgi:threonine dehydrogenase-like Zn-dependent dehydrogenase